MATMRYVEYWTDTGALQRESDAPLDASPVATWEPLLTQAVVPWAKGWEWVVALRVFVDPAAPLPSAPSVAVDRVLFDKTMAATTDAQAVAILTLMGVI